MPKHRFSCLLELHGDQAEAQDEQHSDHGDSDISLLVLAGEQGDQGIGDAAYADPIPETSTYR